VDAHGTHHAWASAAGRTGERLACGLL